MLPAIRRHARIALRYLDHEARDEAVQEVIAGTLAAYVRLVDAGRADLAYPTPLATFAVRQFRAGRRMGTKSNVHDVTSPYAQAAKGIRVGRLDHYDVEDDAWREILIEDRRAGPAQTAAARLDFAQWLTGLPARQRQIAEVLATGQSTKQAARQFRVSAGRVSQIRRELKASWERFQGETPIGSAVA
jgi:DNA-binding NarL/FixJ family response regulator